MPVLKPRSRRNNPPRAVVILSAFPRRAQAERAARLLVRERLLACATLTPNAAAVYRWKGRDVVETGVLFWGKTIRSRARLAVRALKEAHPDEVPEILILPVQGGHAPYLEWVAGEVRRKR